MRGVRVVLAVVAGLMLSSRSLEAGNIWEDWILSGSTVRAVVTGMEVLLSLASRLSALPVRADGGGDGGSGGSDGGGTGDGGSSDDSTGTGPGTVQVPIVLVPLPARMKRMALLSLPPIQMQRL
jgi:hypothetical protein